LAYLAEEKKRKEKKRKEKKRKEKKRKEKKRRAVEASMCCSMLGSRCSLNMFKAPVTAKQQLLGKCNLQT